MNASGLRWVTAALLGVVAGHVYSLEVGTARVLDELDDEAYLRFKTAMDARYQRRIGPVWMASLVTGATALVLDRRAARSAPAATASLALNATAFAILLTVNEPANAEHARVLAGQRPQGASAALRGRWNAGQTARTWLVGGAFTLALASAGGGGTPPAVATGPLRVRRGGRSATAWSNARGRGPGRSRWSTASRLWARRCRTSDGRGGVREDRHPDRRRRPQWSDAREHPRPAWRGLRGRGRGDETDTVLACQHRPRQDT